MKISKFFILGIFSTVIDLSIYTLLLTLGVHYTMAIIIGYLFGFIFNFYAGRKFVFIDGSKIKNIFKEFLYLFIINILAIILNILIVYILFIYLEIFTEFISRIFAIAIVFFWNYYIRKFFVYH